MTGSELKSAGNNSILCCYQTASKLKASGRTICLTVANASMHSLQQSSIPPSAWRCAAIWMLTLGESQLPPQKCSRSNLKPKGHCQIQTIPYKNKDDSLLLWGSEHCKAMLLSTSTAAPCNSQKRHSAVSVLLCRCCSTCLTMPLWTQDMGMDKLHLSLMKQN